NLTVLPYNTSAETILALHPDGVMLTNGPGDPKDVPEAIERARQLANEADDLKKKTRVFHQRLSLMLETQLEQVKSEEWEELSTPFSNYVGESHTV
ncbi:glutamine amidotransferase-related protein, partial [Enterococcus faecalis]